jgi:hypothetical protein
VRDDLRTGALLFGLAILSLLDFVRAARDVRHTSLRRQHIQPILPGPDHSLPEDFSSQQRICHSATSGISITRRNG